MDESKPQSAMLTPSVDRILAALLHVMTAAGARQKKISQYDLLKTLFLADRSHLNEWGRPITYDNYIAMKHGPVPSLSYDFLKSNTKALRDFGVQKLPWEAINAGNGVMNFFPSAEQAATTDVLSQSDVEALDDALGTVLRLGFGQIRKLTHEDPAYMDAWRENGGKAAYEMKLGLLFDAPNFEKAQELAEYSPYV